MFYLHDKGAPHVAIGPWSTEAEALAFLPRLAEVQPGREFFVVEVDDKREADEASDERPCEDCGRNTYLHDFGSGPLRVHDRTHKVECSPGRKGE